MDSARWLIGPEIMTVARRFLGSLLPLLVSIVIIGWLLATVGFEPFLAAFRSLSLLSVGAALCLGTAATLIQAQRWRLVSRGFGVEIEFSEAIVKCWQASFLNSVLPGGLAGDALRTVEQRGQPNNTWRGSIGSVLGERLAGTVVVLVAASIALVSYEPWLAAAVFAAALVTAACAWPSLRRLTWNARAGVMVLSVTAWLVFIALFALATWFSARPIVDSAGFSVMPVGDVVGLGALTLAGMSLPVSWGGWGPREGAAAWAFVLFGYSAQQGVEIAVGYGLLALVSVLPGAAVLLVRALGVGQKRGTRRLIRASNVRANHEDR